MPPAPYKRGTDPGAATGWEGALEPPEKFVRECLVGIGPKEN